MASSLVTTCFLSPMLIGFEWECSEGTKSIETLKQTPEGRRKIANLQTAFSDIPAYKACFNISGALCSNCEDAFTDRPGTSCKGFDHPSSRRRGPLSAKNTHLITAKEYIQKFRLQGDLKPNSALCLECYNAQLLQSEPDLPSDDEEYEPPASKKKLLESLNASIASIPGVAPLILGKRNVAGQAKALAKSLKEIDASFRDSFRQLGMNVPSPPDTAVVAQWKQDSEDLTTLMEMLKERIQDCSKAEKRSLLTLCPPSWTHKHVADFFEEPESLIRSSRKQGQDACCILPQPKTKSGKKIALEVKQKVLEYYYADDVSRCCPGANDVVSVKDPVTGKREKKQKKYLMANLKELYQNFKELNPTLKIGISTFVSLRPQEILSHTTKGRHNVCLCVYHENVKLLFNALNEKSIKPFISSMVCDIGSKNCMFRRCPHCINNKSEVQVEIRTIVAKLQKPVIRYKRWLTTDGTSFVQEEKSAADFESFIVNELESLLKHHYLSRAQHEYFKKVKDGIQPGQVVVWGDFAENFAPVIQDAIQSEYFSHKQITIHPFNVYFRHEQEIRSFAYSIISDCTTHDTSSFYVFQHALIKDLRLLFTELKVGEVNQIIYFSDGCAAQYKNRKNFCNLFFHNKDFNIKAEWNFFPTAHGKGPCDGHGGTTKRLARIASLRGEHIITATDLFNWCSTNIKKIKYLMVTQAEVDETVDRFGIAERYDNLKTVHGTQQAHCVKVEDNKIVLYETSEDTALLTSKIIGDELMPPSVLIDESSVDDWIAGAYCDNEWYVGKIGEVDVDVQEVKVIWYRGSSRVRGVTFVPEGQITWLPYGRILRIIPTPQASSRGRTVNIPILLQEEFDKLLQRLLS